MTSDDIDFVVVDVETTGISPNHGDRIVEFAAIRLNSNAEPIDTYTTLINPGRDVGPTYIHGISQEDVANAPSFEDVAG
ncbi:MAG: 3'-5' exonuclease, partial [Bdellovibrionales bacterium]|nr:3'-5' exonuclease [Bdellovibrionales bacterium]